MLKMELSLCLNNEKISPRNLKKLSEDGLKKIFIQEEELIGSYLSEDLINEQTGEVLFEAGHQLDEDAINSLKKLEPKTIKILIVDSNNAGPWILNTFG